MIKITHIMSSLYYYIIIVNITTYLHSLLFYWFHIFIYLFDYIGYSS